MPWRRTLPALAVVVLAACSGGEQIASELPSNPYLDRTEEPALAPVAESASATPEPPPSPTETGPITDPYEVVDLDRPVVAPENDWLGLAKVDRLAQSNEWSNQAAWIYFGEVTGEEKPATDTSLPEPPARRWTNEVELWNSLAPVWRQDLLREGPSYRKPLFEGMPAQWLGGGPLWGEEHTDGAGLIYSWDAAVQDQNGRSYSRVYAVLIKTQPDGSGEIVAVMPPTTTTGENPEEVNEESAQKIWEWYLGLDS